MNKLMLGSSKQNSRDMDRCPSRKYSFVVDKLNDIVRRAADSELMDQQFTPAIRRAKVCRNQTTCDILNQIYEMQQKRKQRNKSMMDDLQKKQKQVRDTITFQRIVSQRKYVKAQSRQKDAIQGQSIIQEVFSREDIKPTPELQSILPSANTSIHRRVIPQIKLDTRYWTDAFPKIMSSPSYFEMQQLINFSNGICVLPGQMFFKAYVGKGNNHLQVRGMFSVRSQWQNTTDEKEANLIWTQKYIHLGQSEFTPQQRNISNDQGPHIIDSTDQSLIKLAWNKVENKSKKKLQEYVLDSAPLLTNLNTVKLLVQINHQTQNLVIHNHLKEGNQLGDKKFLFLNLSSYCQQEGIDLQSIIPLTFHVNHIADKSFLDFTSHFIMLSTDTNLKNIWIVKPGEDTNRGTGIKVVNSIEEVTNIITNGGHTYIIQKYMEFPFLYQKRKFDIRGYALVIIFNGVKKAFWYRKGYLRTSSSLFMLDNLNSQKIHLTNDAIQNRMNDYGKFEKGNKLSYEQFESYLQEENKINGTNYQFDSIYQQMKEFTKIAIKSAIPKMQNNGQFVGFELYGIDFMITDQFKPVLIEFNTNPCIETGCPILAKVIISLLDNLFKYGNLYLDYQLIHFFHVNRSTSRTFTQRITLNQFIKRIIIEVILMSGRSSNLGIMVKKLNVFTKPVDLLIHNEIGHRTYSGVFLTWSITAVLCTYLWGQFMSVIYKDNPLTEYSDTHISQQPPITLTQENFTLSLSSRNYNINSLYSVSLIVKTINQQLNQTSSINVPMISCSNQKVDAYYLSSKGSLCIDWTQVNSLQLQGSLDSSLQTYMLILMNVCDKSKSTCLDPLTVQQMTSNDDIEIKITSSYYDTSNYSTPNALFGRTFHTLISNSFSKIANIIYQPVLTQSDQGYVLPDYLNLNTIKVNNYIETTGSNALPIFQVFISLDTMSYSIQRSYSKIQDVLGNIGGLWQIFYIAISVFMIPYNIFTYQIKLLNEIFNFDNQSKKSNETKVVPIQDDTKKSKLQQIFQKALQLEKMNRASGLSNVDPGSRSKMLEQINESISEFFKSQEGKLHISIIDYLTCVPCRNTKGSKSELIQYSMKKITHNLDIIYIIRKLQEIDKLKMLLLSTDQIKLFDFIPKPTIRSINNLDSFNEQYTILRPDKSDLQKALEAQGAYLNLSKNAEEKINKQLISYIDEDLIKLFKINMGSQVNKGVSQRGLPSMMVLEQMPSQINESDSDSDSPSLQSHQV